MGLKYLWDTNAVIYFLQKQLSPAAEELMNNIIDNHQPSISAITQIELLCWKTNNKEDVAIVKSFISDCVIVELEHDIKLRTVAVRKAHSIKLPDAIITATAIERDMILISKDKAGFKKISTLEWIDPI